MDDPLRKFRREIDSYIRNQPRRAGLSPLTMEDVYESAVDCQRGIEAMGYRWDRERMLWRAPTAVFYRRRPKGD